MFGDWQYVTEGYAATMVGTVTLSVEIELGWGYHDLGRYEKLSEGRLHETHTLRRILEWCEQFGVPMSFDVVGTLFERGSEYPTRSPHPDGWFDAARRATRGDERLFSAPDMVTAIEASRVPHEICTHTYSHVTCDEVEPRVVDWELSRAAEVHSRVLGRRPTSLVPPRHGQPPKSVLRDNGIEAVRVATADDAPTRLHKFNRLVVEPPEPREPRLVDGVLETYCPPYTTLAASSLPFGQVPPPAFFRAIPTRVRQRVHERYLARAVEKAIAQDSYVHLWGHLHELAHPSQWGPLRSVLETLARRRDEVEVLTMERLNDRVREREPTVQVEPEAERVPAVEPEGSVRPA